MSPEELERRRPVWTALSELWLDSELDEATLEHSAVVLARSGFDERELRAIYEREVEPALAANLDLVAGEWSGFDPKWLEERCLEAAERRPGPIGRWLERFRAQDRRASAGQVLDDLLVRVARLRSQR